MGEKENRVEREKEDVRRGCIDRMRDDSRERKAEKVKGITSISKRHKKKNEKENGEKRAGDENIDRNKREKKTEREEKRQNIR